MRAMSLMLPVLSLTALIGCGGDSRRSIVSPQLDVSDPAAGPSASGHGNWINAAGEYVSRSFHAREQEPGVVEGSWEYHFTSPTGEKRLNKGEVDCLRIIAPNEAVISGRVLVTENPALLNQTQIFRVVDNGEGDGEPTDRLSALFARSPESGIDCSNFTPPTTTPIVSGNLQVRP
jgi:hypothetical protein